MKNYKFKFSVIIPIYNVEDYLQKTIESVINQTIGFEENIQLILVNDGSPDNSENICLEFKDKYPNNVVYIKQKNAGVSAARNKGIEYAEGEFINFLDSDDLWDNEAFSNVYNASQKNQSINIFSCKMCFFDAKKGNHPLNYKYESDKIVDIMVDYMYPQLSASSLFIKKDALNGHAFDTKIRFSEDNKFINEIIFEQRRYMVLKKPTYFYRKRVSNSSAIQTQTQNADWYTVTPEYVYKYLMQLSKDKFGCVIKYIQYLVMYDVNWRINVTPPESLSKKDNKKYIEVIGEILSFIDDDVILKCKNADVAHKIYVLTQKYHNQPIEIKDNKIIIDNVKIDFDSAIFLKFDRIYMKNDKMYMYGRLDLKYLDKNKLAVYQNDKKLKITYYELTNDDNEETYKNDHIHEYIGVSLCIDIQEFKLAFKYDGNIISPSFQRNNIFYEHMPHSYRQFNKYVITYDAKKKIIASVNNRLIKRMKYEISNELSLIKEGQFKSAMLRLMISFYKTFKRKKIMLVSDRIDKSDDNGEHFFKYMIDNHPEYRTYFVLSKKSKDYNRLASIGPVLDNNSKKYKFLLQVSDYVVSSQAENYIVNVLGKANRFIQDKADFKFVFLQHGIIKDDLSPWLNINTKRLDMFVTSSKSEYESLLNCKYYYGKNIVKLTGLPRFDNLLKIQKDIKPKRQILMSFTWRNSLSSEIDKETGKRLYNPKFKESSYFKSLNALLNDPKLLATLNKYNYKIKFVPHPNVMTQLEDFTINEYVDIADGNLSYQKEFCENSLLVTDYSSVFFDFAYLKKPVVYMQTDRKEFFAGQLYNEGYFDYNKMGFGPVCDSVDKTVASIIKYIEADRHNNDKYLKRIDDFYTFHDNKNCERVFKEIEKL